jgi:hemerythrin
MGSDHYVEWQEHYSVGIPLIDDQHKELIKLTDNLYKACLEGNAVAGAYFKEVVHSTVDYIKFHFTAEERIMANVNYPDLAVHKKQHESFVKKVIEDAKRFEEGKAVAYIFKVQNISAVCFIADE